MRVFFLAESVEDGDEAIRLHAARSFAHEYPSADIRSDFRNGGEIQRERVVMRRVGFRSTPGQKSISSVRGLRLASDLRSDLVPDLMTSSTRLRLHIPESE